MDNAKIVKEGSTPCADLERGEIEGGGGSSEAPTLLENSNVLNLHREITDNMP